MLKKSLVIGFVFLLNLSVLYGSDFKKKDEFSLIGLDLGFGKVDYEINDKNKKSYKQKLNALTHIGLKLGAESYNYRIFLVSNYSQDLHNNFDYIVLNDVELDYLFHLHKKFNLYLGGHIGIAAIKFQADGESFSRTLSDGYFGANMGANIYLTKRIDLDVGTKLSFIDGVNLKNNVEYRFNDTMTFYISLVLKY